MTALRLALAVLALALVAVFHAAPSPADCIDYAEYFHWAGSTRVRGAACGVAMSGSHAYVASDRDGLNVVDNADPGNPRRVAILDTPGHARAVAASGMYADIADGEWGLQVVDVSNPVAPHIVGTLDMSADATAICVAGNYAYVGRGVSGTEIVDRSNRKAPRSSGVRTEIHDVRGRLVRRPPDEALGAGDHQRRWDGRDDVGARVPAGVYFARVLTSDGARTGWILLTR